MVGPACTDDQFMALFDKIGATKLSVKLGVNERSVYARRRRLEIKYDQPIATPSKDYSAMENTARLHIDVPDGIVLVGGDGHYWPGKASTAHRAFVKFAKELKPKAIMYNGDAFDGAAISRHPSIGWENQPSVIEEIEVAQLRLGEIEHAAPRNCKLVWPAGNHDLRYETILATKVPEFRKVRGFHLKDSFPAWKTAWSCWINNKVVVKHRINGGAHATYNNVKKAGMSVVTNHLHALKVTPVSDYRDRPLFGVDCGTLADPNGPQFVHYSEDNPKDHRSGFAVLTFRKGELLWPELVHVFSENAVEFRGSLIRC
jgi:hypothetical protein